MSEPGKPARGACWVLFLILIGTLFIWAVLLMHLVPAGAQGHPDTNPGYIQRWFRDLTNHMGGSCCGEADGYPAAVDEMATPTHQGRGHVIDPSGKEIWVQGVLIKRKLMLVGDLSFVFDWNRVTQEGHGNPFDTAYVFLSVNDNGDGTGTIVHTAMAQWTGVYCVAPLPLYY